MKLTIKKKPDAPLEAENISPLITANLKLDEIKNLEILHGNIKCTVDNFFNVKDDKSEVLTIQGDLSRVKYLGAKMDSGEMIVNGNAGMHLGSAMSGGTIKVNGDVEDWIAPEMSGGIIHITGNGGHCIGSAYRGASVGITGGEIIIEGNVKNEIGNGMSNATIFVGGDVGDFTGVNMNSGTIVLYGEAGIRTGAGMKRGTIISMNRIEMLPTFSYNCSYSPLFLKLIFESISKASGIKIDEKYFEGKYDRWSGDSVEMNRGELLVFAN
tara:strand:+ start:492 stop:1298 length:807 start_codon:yes stop_codon:yes gene_type:complete